MVWLLIWISFPFLLFFFLLFYVFSAMGVAEGSLDEMNSQESQSG